jgi:hypothetical protein
MKKRLHDKKAGIAILLTLIVLSLLEIILRAAFLKKAMGDIPNAGEPIINALFSLMLIIFAVKGKDRLFYICTGGFLACFVINQLFHLPGMFTDLVQYIIASNIFGSIAAVAHICSIISIVAIGVLLVEYMNDGTIYNKAFNILCIVTVILLLFLFFHTQNDAFSFGNSIVVIASLHELSRLAMVFLFTFFAYDSAKAQLSKADLTK